MKKTYLTPNAEIVALDTEDIVLVSSTGQDQGGGGGSEEDVTPFSIRNGRDLFMS